MVNIERIKDNDGGPRVRKKRFFYSKLTVIHDKTTAMPPHQCASGTTM